MSVTTVWSVGLISFWVPSSPWTDSIPLLLWQSSIWIAVSDPYCFCDIILIEPCLLLFFPLRFLLFVFFGFRCSNCCITNLKVYSLSSRKSRSETPRHDLTVGLTKPPLSKAAVRGWPFSSITRDPFWSGAAFWSCRRIMVYSVIMGVSRYSWWNWSSSTFRPLFL